MQVEINGLQASVSDDGRDIQFAAPQGDGRTLAFPFLAASHTQGSSSGASSLVSPPAAEAQVLAADIYGRAGVGIIVCVFLVVVATKRFGDRAGAGRGASRSRLLEELDDTAFLKRYGRGA